jgi:8-oxo-dGTP pyrophosphatase MutT (NUDIX family)
VKRARAELETSAGGVVVRMASADDGCARPLFLIIRDSYDNWGFPKGHVEDGERPEAAALREVIEETGIDTLTVRSSIDTIDWYFRFRGRLIHKVCHFFLMITDLADTSPQRSEGITACRWEPYEDAAQLVSYANARDVLRRANEIVTAQRTAS